MRRVIVLVLAVGLEVKAEELGRMRRVTATLTHDGRSVTYEGVPLREILESAGLGALRGPALAQFVLAEAKDGYRVVFSRGELDKEFGDLMVLVADQRAARSVRMLVRLAVMAPAP